MKKDCVIKYIKMKYPKSGSGRKYPRYFINIDGGFKDDTKFVCIFSESLSGRISNNGNIKEFFSEYCNPQVFEKFVKRGIWREVSLEEVALM